MSYQPPLIWDQSGNYPAGSNPWNGTPKRVPVAQTYFTPNLKPPAQNFNDILAQVAAWEQYAAPLLPQAAQKWGPAWSAASPSCLNLLHSPPGGTSNPQLFKPSYDASVQAWLVPWTVELSSDWTIYLAWTLGADDGGFIIYPASGPSVGLYGWNPQLATSSSIVPFDTTGFIDAASCPDPATPGIVWTAILSANNQTLKVQDSTYNGSSWVSQYTLTTAGTVPLTVEMAGIGTHVVVGVGGTSGAIIALYNGTTSGGWAPVAGVSGVNHQGWFIKSNGSLLIAVPSIVQATQLWTTPDGVTFTSRSISSIVPTGAAVAGLCWSPGNSLWYMAIQLTTSTTAFYSSPDGITWTKVSTGTGPNIEIADMECGANGLVVTTQDASISAPLPLTNQSQVFFSADFGVTWVPSRSQLLGNLSSAAVGYSRARLASAPDGLIVANSQYGRFSGPVGLLPHL